MSKLHLLGVRQRDFGYELAHQGFLHWKFMRELRLSGGQIALVDKDDYPRLSWVPWSINGDGYATTSCSKRFVEVFGDSFSAKKSHILMRRLVMEAFGAVEVDHKNGAKLHNFKDNLRFATKAENQMNSKSRPGSSEFKGVSWKPRDKAWRATLTLSGKQIYLGLFSSENLAAAAYDSAALAFFGEFASLNFPLNIPEKYQPWVPTIKAAAGYIGVSPSGKKFAASCKVFGKQTHLGSFASAFVAARHRDNYLNENNLIGRRNFKL